MKFTQKIIKVAYTLTVLGLGINTTLAGTLTSNEVAQIENAFGITLSTQEKTDLGNIVKPDTIDAWRTAAESRIDTHRKAALTVLVEDSVGTPVPSAQVAVKLKKNAFKFGGVGNPADVDDGNGELANEGKTAAYWKNFTTNMFNAVGANNAFKPKITSQHAELPDFIDWATNNNIDVRAHLLIWPGGSHLSNGSTSDYAHYNVSGAYSTYTNNPTQLNLDALKAEVDAEIAEWAGRWDVYEWDVINETRGNTDLQDVLGYDQEAAWFNIASNNIVDPDAKLYINENQIISSKSVVLNSSHYTDRRDIYFTTIDRLVASNAPIHGVGFQNRYKWEHLDPIDVYNRLDDFGTRYGLQLAGTEFEIKHVEGQFTPTEYTRAQITEETLAVYYSHAQGTGLNAWDFMSPSSSVSTDTNEWSSAMAWYDGTIKLNALTWYYVHRIRYNTDTSDTTDIAGNAAVAGAHKGDYDITVTYNGSDYPATATLSSNQTVVVTLGDVTLLPSANSPVFTVDPISMPNATQDVAYAGQSITNSATDADGDTLTYSKLQGPTWLSIAENGDLSGTPVSTDSGQNSWIVQVSDGFNTDAAVLSISVIGSGGGASPVTNNVSEDQYIYVGQPTTVQNLDTRLDTRNSSQTSFSRIPYLKFVTGSLPGTIASATLNIFSETELDVVHALAVVDSSWQATNLTWNNAPTRGSLIGSGQAASADSWFTIDVTSHITGAGTFSIALDEQANSARQYLASSRSGNGAYLYITFTGGGNNPPVFSNNPVVEAGATQDEAYAGSTLADNASDADLDSMTFAKVSGPSWLNVATNGVLSGTPLVGDLGANSWQVSVTDGTATNFANLQIVVSAPIQVVSPQNGTNILFIAIDDINPVLGCYGDTLAISPNIDSLAASGVTFLNAHAQWSVCGPSRASLMTSLMPEEILEGGFKKMRGDAVDTGRVNSVKRPNVVTIPQHFRYNGYRTAATGKINDNRCVGTLDTGTLKVAEDGNTVDDPPSWGDPVDPNALPLDFFSNSSFVKAANGWSPAGKPVTAATNLADSAFTDGIACDEGIALMQNLATNDTQFFLGVGFKKPHLAFVAPQQYWDMHDINDFNIHPFQDHPLHEVSYTWNYANELAGYDEFAIDGNSVTNIPDALQKEMLHGYYACVSFIDAQVGRLLAELDTLGLADNTIVVLWGDHGFHLGDHAEWAKHTNLEQATRVPLIVHNPFSGQSDVKTQTPAALLDIYPTLCELAGLPIPEQPLAELETPTTAASGRSLKGQSLAGVVNGTTNSVRTGAVNLFARNGANGYAYRTDRYRYTEWIDGGVVVARELYDYVNDPLETVNLAGESGYDALMYSFSISMREEFEQMKLSGGDIAAPELQNSPVYDTTGGDYSLAGIALSGTSVSWSDAEGVSYNLVSTTNLTDATWTTNQTGLSGSPTVILQDEQQEFFKVEVVPAP